VSSTGEYVFSIEYHPWRALFMTMSEGGVLVLFGLFFADIVVFSLSGNAALVQIALNVRRTVVIFHSSFNTITNSDNVNVGEFNDAVKNAKEDLRDVTPSEKR
jgi:hypothetical protein